MVKRRRGSPLERWEIALIKAMLLRGGYNDQDILAYFTRPTRSVNHRAIGEIRTETKHKAVKASTTEQLMDPSRKSGGALHRLHCFCLEFDGACEVQRRVPTDWIMEPIDVSGYGSFSLAS